MKKLFFCVLFFMTFIVTHGQGVNVIGTPDTPQYIYVGSLIKDINSGSNVDKIKVELLGGDTGSSYIGSTIYRIGTSSGYRINKESFGGQNASHKHKLRIFENGDNVDIVIETIGWTVFMIRSWKAGYPNTPIEVKCETYNITGKKDITDKFPTTIYLSSNISGNVGIGTDRPQSKLDVRGAIRAKEVKIEMSAGEGADFVFEPDYVLKPLNEVESFIKDNKHLPEIPSAKQMVEDGLNLNEMQIKLLQKIEELTLYVIDLKKENESIKQELKELKKE